MADLLMYVHKWNVKNVFIFINHTRRAMTVIEQVLHLYNFDHGNLKQVIFLSHFRNVELQSIKKNVTFPL